MWTTVLDPRCRQLKHLRVEERERCKELLIENTIREPMLDDPVIQYSASSDTNADASPRIKHRNTLSLFEASEEEDSILDSPLKDRCNNEMDHDNMINTEQEKLFVQKSVECEVERN